MDDPNKSIDHVEAELQGLKDTQQLNLELSDKLKEQVMAQNVELARKLQTAMGKVESLTKDKVSLTSKLEKERNCRLQLRDQLERQKLEHHHVLEAVKQSSDVTEALRLELKTLKEANQQLTTKLQDEEELRQPPQAPTDRLLTNMKTESLTKEKGSVTTKLETGKESEALQKSTAEKLESLQKLNYELNHTIQAKKDFNSILRGEASRLSIALKTQLKMNENLSKLRQKDITKLQSEHSCRLELQNQLERQKHVHQQALEAVKQFSKDKEFLTAELRKEQTWRVQLSDQLESQNLGHRQALETVKQYSKDKEFLSAELKKEQMWRLQLSDQQWNQKLAHHQALEAVKQSNLAALHQILEALIAAKQELSSKLQVEEELRCYSQDLVDWLSTNLETETKRNECLTKEKASLTAKLEKEQIWRLQLRDQLEDQKLTHQQAHKAVKQFHDVKEALCWELETLKEANQQFTTKLQIEEELRWRSQCLTDRLLTNLKTEMKKNESLTNEKKLLTAELETEHTWRLQLIQQLEKHKNAHLKESEALQKSTAEKLESLQKLNSELNRNIRAKKDFNTILKGEASRLSVALQTQMKMNENVSKLRDKDIAKSLELQNQLERQKHVHQQALKAVKQFLKDKEFLTVELRKEQTWRLQLSDQLESQKLDLQQKALEAVKQFSDMKDGLFQELESLKEANQKLVTKLQVEEELRCNSQALTDRLFRSLKRSKRMNRKSKAVKKSTAVTDTLKLKRLEKLNSDLNHKLQVERDMSTALSEDAFRLFMALDTHGRGAEVVTGVQIGVDELQSGQLEVPS
ncbi:hypothetical protein JOB18_005886 [Solea senegalensis]|uniref:Uncharacterized protein n=1 Tax=Solea senegalensis TaxID=28829 RepID=A0AAV6T3M7_SOLSE|nr:hypothetical protein JOB18_005886 [Solea senegalensis]